MFKIDTSKSFFLVKQEFLKTNPSPYEVLHSCTHPDPIQVLKKDVAGRPMYKLQCLHCGKTYKQLKKVDVDRDLPVWPWQEKHATDIQAKTKIEYDKWRLLVDDLWQSYYSAYISSSEWRARRAKVIAACGGKCQSCSKNPVAHVHHLSYQNLGDEPLDELAGVCESCHRAMHRHMWAMPTTTNAELRQVAA